MVLKRGTSGSDKLTGTSTADDLYGLGGPDSLSGLGGNDRLFGGSAADAIFGGDGGDQMYGEGGDDYMAGGAGNDFLQGGSGNDRLRGDDGNDRLTGGPGDDDVRGGAGDDTLAHTGQTTDPRFTGTAYYEGGTGKDTLILDVRGSIAEDPSDPASFTANLVSVTVGPGGNGFIEYVTDPIEPQTIPVGSFAGIEKFTLANDSNALVFNAGGNATVVGGAKDDWFVSGSGNQDLTGGAGADDYLFRLTPGANIGRDVIHGFSEDEGDRVLFRYLEGDPIVTTAKESNGNTVYTSVETATGQTVHVLTVDAIGLPPIDFYEIA